MPDKKHYLLTWGAEADLREAKQWSLSRWGKELTKDYFADLDHAAEYVAAHQKHLHIREDLAGETGLLIHPVREHYLVYFPIDDCTVIIVAVIRQSRNVPEILGKSAFMIHREVTEIKKLLAAGELKIP